MEKYSYIAGVRQSRLQYATLPSALDSNAKRFPHKPAYIFRYLENDLKTTTLGKTVVTFDDLATKSLALAASLLETDIKPGDNIAIMASNSPGYCYVEWACFRIGVLMVRLPSNLVYKEMLEEVVEQHHIKALVLDDVNIVEKLQTMLPGCLGEHDQEQVKLIFFQRPPKDHGSACRFLVLSDMYARSVRGCEEIVKQIQDNLEPEDAAIVLPTSGSSGKPKHTIHSHYTFANNIFTFVKAMQPGVTDPVYLSDRPFAWIGGVSGMAGYRGTTMVVLDNNKMSPKISVETFLKVAEEHKVTYTFCLPFNLYDIQQEMKVNSSVKIPSSLKTVITGGEQIPSTIIEFAVQAFGEVALMYGSTESLLVSYNISKSNQIAWLVAMPNVEIKIVDDSGKLLSRGQVGNIQVRAPTTTLGYLGRSQNPYAPLLWLKTGDLGIINEQDKIKIVGRSTDVISKGTTKIYPGIIENVIFKHSKVQRVCVIGVPDPRLYNEVCACVVPAKGQVVTEEELRSYCQEQNVYDKSVFIPKFFMIVDNIPKTSTGKPDKQALIRQAITHLNLNM